MPMRNPASRGTKAGARLRFERQALEAAGGPLTPDALEQAAARLRRQTMMILAQRRWAGKTTRRCTVVGCGDAHYARLLCRRHYDDDRAAKRSEARVTAFREYTESSYSVRQIAAEMGLDPSDPGDVRATARALAFEES